MAILALAMVLGLGDRFASGAAGCYGAVTAPVTHGESLSDEASGQQKREELPAGPSMEIQTSE